MPLGNLTGAHLFVILFIVLLLFGAPKLPALARSLGQSARILKKEVSASDSDDPVPAAPVAADVAPAVAPEPEVPVMVQEAPRAKDSDPDVR